MSTSFPTRQLAGITIPNTPLVNKAIAYARKHGDDFTYNHVLRSCLFAIACTPLVTSTSPTYPLDHEVLAVSTILHDLAWRTDSSKSSTDKRFEVDSANAAREFLLSEVDNAEWPSHRIQLVWDAIALHTTNSIAMHKQPEVMLTHVGISVDFVGPNLIEGGPVTWEIYTEIVGAFPRVEFKEGIKKIMCKLCRVKPETTYDNFVGDFGEMYVQGYDRTGKRASDFCESAIE